MGHEVYAIRYTLYAIRYTLYAIRYTLYAIRYTLYAVRYTLYAIRYTLYAIRYTLTPSYVPQTTPPTIFGGFSLLREVLLRERITLVHAHQAFSAIAHEAIIHGRTMGFKARIRSSQPVLRAGSSSSKPGLHKRTIKPGSHLLKCRSAPVVLQFPQRFETRSAVWNGVSCHAMYP